MIVFGLIGAITGFICYINKLSSEVHMNQYIKFIVRVLLTCFLLPFRRYNTSLCGLEQYLWGWFWGFL